MTEQNFSGLPTCVISGTFKRCGIIQQQCCTVGSLLLVCFTDAADGEQELLDAEKGYVKDDSITLEVFVKADAPHGVR